jgi:catechol 2,3-dioxygenase
MGVSRQNIFGGAEAPQPAIPGTYGKAAAGFRLPNETKLGRVKLQISDLGRSLEFYEQTLGLNVLDRGPDYAILGPHDAGGPALVELHEHVGARARPRAGRLGLYHFAILMPDRPSLGRLVQHLSATDVRVGSADHLVSEALYLQDPDNLGIEVYVDRPRADWKRSGRELMMATDPLDLRSLLSAAGSAGWTGMPSGTVMGHVHLHVGDIRAGAAYFSGALGFDQMVWSYPGALFLGAGGYHHHLGTNTWAGTGATAPSDRDARLMEWTVELPDASSLADASESLTRAGFAADSSDDGASPSLVTRDPWGTQIRLQVSPVIASTKG